MKLSHTNPYYCDPPGAYREILAHPVYRVTKAIEKATVKEHRFAFFYWVKWIRSLKDKNKIITPPLLVSIDYHRDLAAPSENERTELDEVDQFNFSDLAMFCWARMNPLNDGHILSAAYLNLIGDIILLKYQEDLMNDTNIMTYKDKYGNEHKIYEFTNVDLFEKQILQSNSDTVFLDIDLDYFISTVGNYNENIDWVIMSNDEIKEIINPDRKYIRWIFERLEGITIATEPSFCGSYMNSFKILTAIEEQFFNGSCKWIT